MATYVHKKTRAFKSPCDTLDLPLKAKSLFHLKTYPSATDPRAWTQNPQERQQYILDLVSANPECTIGRFINAQTLLKTLFTNKNKNIRALQSRLSLMDAFIDHLKLSPEQKEALYYVRTKTFDQDTVNWTENMQSATHDILIDVLSKKFKEQEAECAKYKNKSRDAKQKLHKLQTLVEDQNSLLRTHEKVKESLTSQIESLSSRLGSKQIRSSNLSVYHSVPICLHSEETLRKKEKSGHDIKIESLLAERDHLQKKLSKTIHDFELFKANHCMDQNKIIRERNAHEKELQIFKKKMQNFDIKCIECDRLRLQLIEMSSIQKCTVSKYQEFMEENKELISRSGQEIDRLKEQIITQKSELDRYKRNMEQVNALNEKCNNLQKLVNQKEQLIRTLELRVNAGSRGKLTSLEEELMHKDNLIRISEGKLAQLQKQLRNSIDTLSAESTILKNGLRNSYVRIKGLLDREREHVAEIDKLKLELRNKHTKVDKFETKSELSLMIDHKNNLIDQLKQKLIELNTENEKLTVITCRIQAYMAKNIARNKSNPGIVTSDQIKKDFSNPINTLKFAQDCLKAELLDDSNLSYLDTKFSHLHRMFKEIQILASNHVEWLTGEVYECKKFTV